MQENTNTIPVDFKPDLNLKQYADELRPFLIESSRIVAFTGAGVSAESGIPTYRGAGGLWSKFEPEKFASIEYFRKDPSYYWRFFRDARHDVILNAKPNLGHLALAELERRGKLRAIITQNIDNLHYEAGSSRVLELHGNTTRFYCLECGRKYTIHEAWEKVQKEVPVHCDSCNGIVRADVVMYGEMLPQKEIIDAETETHECDMMLMIGSSLVVYPAANLPYEAKLRGKKVIIINVDPTPLDSAADLVINQPAANILAQAVWCEER